MLLFWIIFHDMGLKKYKTSLLPRITGYSKNIAGLQNFTIDNSKSCYTSKMWHMWLSNGVGTMAASIFPQIHFQILASISRVYWIQCLWRRIDKLAEGKNSHFIILCRIVIPECCTQLYMGLERFNIRKIAECGRR